MRGEMKRQALLLRSLAVASFNFIALCFLGVVGHPALAVAQTPGTFTTTGSMTTARAGHTATLLLNGKVLIAGGSQPFTYGPFASLASTELYDPSTGAFTSTGSMTTARAGASATLLADGRVLIAGGYNSAAIYGLATAETYDPSTGTFTATGDMIAPGGGGFLRPGGRVLFFGERNAQIYDPVAGTFADAGEYAGDIPRTYSKTPLANGKFLITGDSGLYGVGMPCDVYDPLSLTFGWTGPMPDGWRSSYSATLLPNGQVLISGGENDWSYLASAELYDPVLGTFSSTHEPMTTYRELSPATLLADGTVLIAGGELYGGGADASAEIYDSAADTFAATGSMTLPRFGYTATLLIDGTVLIAGGLPWFTTPTSSAEIYRPKVLKAAPALLSFSGGGQGQGAIWHATTGDIASPGDPAVAGEALSMYCTGLAEGSLIPPQVAIGGRLAEILFFGGAPGYPGFSQVNFRVPGGVMPGSAVPVRLTYLGRPSNEVTIGVR